MNPPVNPAAAAAANPAATPAADPRPAVAVLGSLNMDCVIGVTQAPQPGETVAAQRVQYASGGKGANQAVACARQGAPVRLVGCVGADEHGERLLHALAQDGVDTRWVARRADASTGLAFVIVEASGQNRIIVHAGANATLDPDDAALRQMLDGCAALVLQLETPLALVLRAARLAAALGCRVVLNPSPCLPLPDALWPLVTLLVVNEVEAAHYAGHAVTDAASAAAAARALRARSGGAVLVTLGAAGAVACDADGCRHHPALAVPRVVDTTAAGDTFLGAAVARQLQGGSLDAAVVQGLRAASHCVQVAGAQPSIPTLADLAALPWPALPLRLDPPPKALA